MDKRYIVFKCCTTGREPIVCFDAVDIEEAKENLHWLKTRHAQEKQFQLGLGEFFEILEKSQVEEAEWEEATSKLCTQKGGKA